VWGNKFVENLSRDIKLEFPRATGYSARNLRYMATFAKTYTDYEILQTLSAKLPWSHNTTLLDKVKDDEERLGYIQQTRYVKGRGVCHLLIALCSCAFRRTLCDDSS